MNDYPQTSTIFNWFHIVFLICALFLCAACENDPEGDELFTSTGITINDFISENEQLTSFEYILSRIGLDKRLGAWGEYTCFAPTNEGVKAYIDSLWNDSEARIPRNGLTENSLQGLTDSLCHDIAEYHLLNGKYSIVSLAESSGNLNTVLGFTVSTRVENGFTMMNNARIIGEDKQAVNGVCHVVDKVIARSTRLIADEIEHVEGFSIFVEAFKLTGMRTFLEKTEKSKTFTINDDWDVSEYTGVKTATLYWPEKCRVGFTILAESDEVMAKNGIRSIDDLIEYANSQYKNCAGWYDYVSEKGISVSTGDDYTNQWNALNMFVRYHILFADMSKGQFVFEKGSDPSWNYNNTLCGGEPYDYYETFLPNTLIKVWEPQAYACGTSTDGSSKKLYINRYRPNNTLTDEVGTLGSKAMHGTIREKIRIDTSLDRQAYNGHIHAITDMLVYDWAVKNEVLHERMRFDTANFLPELINNGAKFLTTAELSVMNGGGDGLRMAFPIDYFDNVVCYNDKNKLRYTLRSNYRSWESDTFQGWGNYDLAIKLPPLPTSTYEMRIVYYPWPLGGFMQFYMGTSTDRMQMQPLGIPLDVRIESREESIGWTPPDEEEDMGIESDRSLRSRGYMRGPFSYRGHGSEWPEATTGLGNCRTDGNVLIRKIITTQLFRQSDDHWFRIKNMLVDGDAQKWQLDFVEFIPVDVLNNERYQEDWM